MNIGNVLPFIASLDLGQPSLVNGWQDQRLPGAGDTRILRGASLPRAGLSSIGQRSGPVSLVNLASDG